MYSQKIIQKRLSLLEDAFSKSLGKKFSFEYHSPSEVEEWNHRLRDAFDSDGVQCRPFSDDEGKFILNDLNLSKLDFEYWASRYATISGDQAHLEKLVLRCSQKKLLQKWSELEESDYPLEVGKVALIVAKARRVGATVLAEAAVAHSCMLRGQAKGLIASDIPENSLQLFSIQDRIYKNLPTWMKPRMSGKVKSEHFMFDGLDSDISIGHGAQKNPMGQGIRLDVIHLTEAATWLQVAIDQIDEDIFPAFLSSKAPTTLFMIESTGKSSLEGGGQWFETQCRMAKEDKGFFRLQFLSWYDAPEMHSRPANGVELRPGTKAVAERIKRDTGFECSKEQLAWYQITREQYELKGNLSGFLREFASTLDECFEYGLQSAWPIEVIDKIRIAQELPLAVFDVDVQRRKLFNKQTGAEWDKDPTNKVLIYEEPKAGFSYVVGVDACYGIEGKDSAAIFVNRVGSRSAKDKQVAEFWGSFDASDLAIPAWILGHIYTDKQSGLPALMAVECNPGSPGLMTQTELFKRGYPNFYTWRKENDLNGGWTRQMGWHTTPSTRPLLTKNGVKAINNGEFLITSPYFVDEMRTFVNYGQKYRRGVDAIEYYAHAPNGHDDRIFAGFIALYVSHDYDRQDIAEDRRQYLAAKDSAKSNPRRMQEIDIAIDELMEDYNDSAGWAQNVIG